MGLSAAAWSALLERNTNLSLHPAPLFDPLSYNLGGHVFTTVGLSRCMRC